MQWVRKLSSALLSLTFCIVMQSSAQSETVKIEMDESHWALIYQVDEILFDEYVSIRAGVCNDKPCDSTLRQEIKKRWIERLGLDGNVYDLYLPSMENYAICIEKLPKMLRTSVSGKTKCKGDTVERDFQTTSNFQLFEDSGLAAKLENNEVFLQNFPEVQMQIQQFF